GEVREVRGVERGAERLEQRAVGRGQTGGKREEAARRPGHPLLEASVVFPVAGEADRLAEVRVSLETQRTGLAGNGGIDGHALAVRGHARELVAEGERPGHRRGARRSLARPGGGRGAH